MSERHSLSAVCQQYGGLLIEETDSALRIACPAVPAPMRAALQLIRDKPIEAEIWPAARITLWQVGENKEGPWPSLPDLLNDILIMAIRLGASDIHIEPTDSACRIRLRIDGTLHLRPLLPHGMAAQMTSRIKVLAQMDIAEKRLPQDGQIDFRQQEDEASFRVSTLPCRYGEKLVLRLQHRAAHAFDIERLGMPPEESARFRHALSSPQGLILITGPTGSGKTLSLYSALTHLNRTERNIVTVEDPVEIPLSGINQTQIHSRAGLTCQVLLRALLRQDPDIIMIGEIRDGETASIAIKASQTGHLVLSTLHTSSAIAAVTRLEQLGIARESLLSSLCLVVAQRLVRKLCLHCRTRDKTPAELTLHSGTLTLYPWRAKGCHRCYAGYSGRIALFEVLPFADEAKILPETHASCPLQSIAQQRGMATLLENGYRAVSQGITSLQEVHRVLGSPHEAC